MKACCYRLLIVLCITFALSPAKVQAQLPALPEGELPKDSRYADPVTLNDYHPFRPVESKAAWDTRREEIIRRVQVGAGLWPMPRKTPMNPVVHGKIHQGDYTVEKVFFESLPGHFVTGSLYRPAGGSVPVGLVNGKRPGVLCPHGHWKNGRFYDAGVQAARGQIAIGAERFMSAGRSPLQARCVQLARMGCVVFHYDTLGNADSMQLELHRRGPREHMSGQKLGEWGFVSPQAMAHLQTNFGLQTWNSERALDFLLEQAEVDPDRILVTGASGGATQTMMISAIDSRVDASFPCVMVSTAMQGGCTCENTHYLRIGQGNVDIAAAVAPRPLGLTAADDWTIELETKGHPDLVKVFKLAGAPKNYEAHFDIHFKHNYNHVSRANMYDFVNRHFKLGFASPVLEQDFERLSPEELTVWDDKHPAPTGMQAGDDHEKAICRWWTEDARAQIGEILGAKDAKAVKKGRPILEGAAEVMIGRGMPEAGEVEFELAEKEFVSGYLTMSGLVRNLKHEEEIPATFIYPESWNGKVAIWIFPGGKAQLHNDVKLPALATKLLNEGTAVMSPDLFRQGESLPEGDAGDSNQRVQYPGATDAPDRSWRLSSVYYYGYNHSLFAQRVHDILSCVSMVRHHPKWEVTQVALIGQKGAGHWAAAARAIAGDQIDRAVIDTSGFRLRNCSLIGTATLSRERPSMAMWQASWRSLHLTLSGTRMQTKDWALSLKVSIELQVVKRRCRWLRMRDPRKRG